MFRQIPETCEVSDAETALDLFCLFVSKLVKHRREVRHLKVVQYARLVFLVVSEFRVRTNIRRYLVRRFSFICLSYLVG